MTHRIGGRRNLYSPCHGAELLIGTSYDGGRDVPEEIMCTATGCYNTWNSKGTADEFNRSTGEGLRDPEAEAALEAAAEEKDTYVDDLIRDTKERASMYTGGPEASRLWKLAETIEQLRKELNAASA
jgi:hypothetical protein